LVERFGAYPPFAGGGAVEVDARVLHALVESGQVKAEVGHGVGQHLKLWRTARGAGGLPDLQEAGRVRLTEIGCLTGHRGGACKDGDFAMFGMQLNESVLPH